MESPDFRKEVISKAKSFWEMMSSKGLCLAPGFNALKKGSRCDAVAVSMLVLQGPARRSYKAGE